MSTAKKLQLQEMAIRSIRVDHDLQSRVEMDMEVVKDYADALIEGERDRGHYDFPPVTVFFDGKTNWLADGFHRVAAYKRAGRVSIPVDAQNGTRRDAMLFSASANLKMGMRPSQKDKEKAVRMLLEDPECFRWSATEIGRKCGVSAQTAKKIMAGFCLERELAVPTTTTRVNKQGKTYKVMLPKTGGIPTYQVNNDRGKSPKARTRINGRNVYLGVDGPVAREKYKEIISRWKPIHDDKRATLSHQGVFSKWLSARSIAHKKSGDLHAFCGILLPGAVCVLLPCLDTSSIYRAIGQVRLLRQYVHQDSRMIVVWYPDNPGSSAGTQTLIELARKDGVEFLTPEQIVEQFASAEPKAE